MTTQTDPNTAHGLLSGWRSPLFETNGSASNIRMVNPGPMMIMYDSIFGGISANKENMESIYQSGDGVVFKWAMLGGVVSSGGPMNIASNMTEMIVKAPNITSRQAA